MKKFDINISSSHGSHYCNFCSVGVTTYYEHLCILNNNFFTDCCLDYDATLKVGNIKNQSIEGVLKSADSKKLRSSMYGLEKLHPTCVKCQSRPVEV